MKHFIIFYSAEHLGTSKLGQSNDAGIFEISVPVFPNLRDLIRGIETQKKVTNVTITQILPVTEEELNEFQR